MAREAAQEVKPASSARANRPTATWSLTPVSKQSIDTVNEPHSTGIVVNPQGKVSARPVGAPSLTLKGRGSTLFPAFDSLEVDPAHNFVTSCNQPPTSVTSPSSSPSTQPTIPASSDFNNRIGNPITTSSESSPVPSSPVVDNDNVTGTGDVSLTTEVVETAVVTSGVVGVTTTSTAADGQITVFTFSSSFTSTAQVKTTIVTTRPTVPAQVPGLKSSAGSYLGGFIGGSLGLLLILVAAFCFFCRRSRKRRRAIDKNVDPYNMIQLSTVNIAPLGEQQNYHHAEMGTNIPSAMPPPLRGIDSGASYQKRGERGITTVISAPQHNNEGDNGNPFRDPDAAEVHQVQQARGALDRLQQLTREVEAELQNLANQVESGQLSVTEQRRLDEIRRTTGLTITYDSRLRRFLSTSSTSSAPPPSYHSSENVPFLRSDLPH